MAIRITKVYTRHGDKGDTHLVGGRRVPKDDLRIESYGTIDELNSILGIVRACNDAAPPSPATQRLDQILRQVQNELFDLGSELATPPDAAWEGMIRIGPEQIRVLERTIDECQASLTPLKSFILPGGGTIAAFLHQARTVCRRAERDILRLMRRETIGEHVLGYVNRLSDLLFVLSRWISHAPRRARVSLGEGADAPGGSSPESEVVAQDAEAGPEKRMTASPIYLRQLELGPMQNYVYLVGDPETREAAVIDAAWEIDAIVETAAADGYTITKALVTHFHPDHLGGRFMGMSVTGAAELVAKLPVKVYLNKREAGFVGRVSDLSASDVVAVDAGDTTEVGKIPLTFVHTPGHTPGSQCFLVDGNLISGDTLFIGSCGRTDLPGSDPADLYHSLNTLRDLPDETVLYPGHNYADRPTSTIGHEKRRNLCMRFDSVDEFLRFMGR